MSFVTDVELKVLASDAQQRMGLDSFQDSLIVRANQWAYAEIVRRLSRRGYTMAQIVACDDGRELQTDLALWKLVSGIAVNQPDSWSKAELEKMDRRKELSAVGEEEFAVMNGGVLQDPLGAAGQVTGGPEDTSQVLFGLDPDDSRIGQETRL
jgi:hypothetical protein